MNVPKKVQDMDRRYRYWCMADRGVPAAGKKWGASGAFITICNASPCRDRQLPSLPLPMYIKPALKPEKKKNIHSENTLKSCRSEIPSLRINVLLPKLTL